jgi:hypothetical protein
MPRVPVPVATETGATNVPFGTAGRALSEQQRDRGSAARDREVEQTVLV